MIGKKSRIFGATLLVSGITIGAAVLALPATTGLAGFIPSLLIIIGVWLFMMLTAFYLLEVNLRMKGESNIISMVRLTLGRPGEVVAWIIYLLLLYSLTSSYLVGCSRILDDFLESFLPFQIPDWIVPVGVFLAFGLVVYLGTEVVDLVNRYCMTGLALGYVGLFVFGVSHIDIDLLLYQNWGYLAPPLAVVATSFGYHIIIPTLSTYLDHDVKALKKALVVGSLIPLLAYIFWQLLALGVIPVHGEVSLTEALLRGNPATIPLKKIVGSGWIAVAARAFAFFSITTSLLGVSLSLADFLSDGLKIKKNSLSEVGVVLLTFIPPLAFALFYPQGFVLALTYAGIFVIILLALLPTLMAYFERYGKETARSLIPSVFTVCGGRGLLIGAIALSLIILAVEVWVL